MADERVEPPLSADLRGQAAALLEAARLADLRGDVDAARQDFERARVMAGGAAPAVLAQALAGLAGLARLDAEFAVAADLLEAAAAAIPTDGVDGHQSPEIVLAAAHVEIERGELVAATGRLVEAEALFSSFLERSGALAAGPDRNAVRARALRALGGVRRSLGRHEPARVALEEAATLTRATFGAESLQHAVVVNELGVLAKFDGRLDDAADAYAQVGAIFVSAGIGETTEAATLEHNLGGLEHARSQFDQAEIHAGRSVELHAKTLGTTHVATDLDRIALAAIVDRLGRRDEARDLILTALPRLRARLGVHPEVAVAVNNLAAIAQGAGDLETAEALYREALAIKEQTSDPDSPSLATTLNNLATILRRRGADLEAAELYARALAILDRAVDPEHPTLAIVRRNLGRVRPPADPA